MARKSEFSRPCRYCKAPLIFRDEVKTAAGKRIPLNRVDGTPHTCDGAEWAFERLRTYRQELAAVPGMANDERLVLDAIAKVADINRRLASYQLRLVREAKTTT